MTDKVQKIHEEVERLKSQLLRGACSSQVAMETLCKEEAYNEVLTILDTLQEEPVSIWHDASEEPNGDNSIVIAYDNGCTVEPSFKDFKSYSEWGIIKKSYRVKQWAYVNDVLNLTNKEEPVSEDLKDAAIEICSKVLKGETITIDGYEYVVLSDAEECFKAGAQWQKQRDNIPSKDLEEAMQHNAPDNIGIDDLLYWRNGFIAGAKWQKQKMMKDAIKGYVDQVEYPGSTWIELSDNPKDLKNGDNVKIKIIKED